MFKLTPQQLRAIKQSPKGVLPSFLSRGISPARKSVSVGGRAHNALMQDINSLQRRAGRTAPVRTTR